MALVVVVLRRRAIVAGILLVAFVAGCGGSAKKTVALQARFENECVLVDSDAGVTNAIVITNTGNSTVVLREFNPSCTCTVDAPFAANRERSGGLIFIEGAP